jgi:NADPH-dependent 2,4-dienoyl-CoA reductase/sulfur reductase-like enzyme/predicted acylesterase/phospholipase RssA
MKATGKTTEVDFLLIGGGLASATAAKTLRGQGAEGAVVILAVESLLPYHRPPLTKGFLLGKRPHASLLVLNEAYFRDHGVQVLLGTRSLAVEPQKRRVCTDSAGDFTYRKLLIATGGYPRRLEVPGADLSSIFYLRTLAEAEALQRAMAKAKRAAVVGSSFIAMELAASFAEQGIKTTLIAWGEDRLYSSLNSPEVSAFFADYYRACGVEIIFRETVKTFRGNGRVERLVTSSGRELAMDLVAVGIEIDPEIGFLTDSGIKLEDGILVDQYLQTNHPDIYAAGDVARFFDPVFRRYRRIEHWDNAAKQGRLAALNMLGQRQAYRAVSYFFSDVFDLSFNFLGDTAEVKQRVLRGSPAEQSFAVLYLDHKRTEVRLRAMFLLERPTEEAQAAESLILNHTDLMGVTARLPDTAFPLTKPAVQTALILQGGGALGAFECGVVRALEERAIHPDVVAGVSIGAFNATIIASHPKNSTAALEAFWAELALDTPMVPNETLRRQLSSWQSLLFGLPKFFRPRWFMPMLHPAQWLSHWTSFYDPTPVKALLAHYVDFKRLKESPIRLLVSAVNVETAELETFDSYSQEITPDHILASGSLPPGFPWTTIDGKHYWDGGIVSNTPLDQVIDRLGCAGKKVYIVNLYPNKKPLPQDLMEVMARRDEIFYAEKIKRDIHLLQFLDRYRQLVEEIMGRLEPRLIDQIKHNPLYLQTLGEAPPLSIKRIVHEGEEGEPPSKDYDFSRASIETHQREGYRIAARKLDQEAAQHA